MIVAGLISGTSADGVDVAICDIRGEPGAMSAEILGGETFAYKPTMRARILSSPPYLLPPCSSRVHRSDSTTKLRLAYAAGRICAETTHLSVE